MLHHGHQLDVREAEIAAVRAELLRQLQIRESLPPGAEMHLVDRDRARVVVLCASFLNPAFVLPLVLRAVDDRRRLRRHLRRLRDRVGAELDSSAG